MSSTIVAIMTGCNIYAPKRNKYKKLIVTKSTTTRLKGEKLYYNPIAYIVVARMTSFSCGGGLMSLYFFVVWKRGDLTLIGFLILWVQDNHLKKTFGRRGKSLFNN